MQEMVGKRQFVRLLLEFYFWDLILVWNEPKSTVPTRFELLFHLCPHQSSFQVFQLGRPIDVLVNLCLLQAARNKIKVTLRCQINESTRLAFLDFFPHPTCLFGPTC